MSASGPVVSRETGAPHENAVQRLMSGAIDCHVHGAPDPFRKRPFDALTLARQAKELGMRAVVFKCHHYCTAPVAEVVNQVIPDFRLIGSVALNREVGGLNPEVVEVAVRAGARIVWMPTQSSIIDTERRRKGRTHIPQRESRYGGEEGIAIIGADGRLLPQMMPILDIIKAGDVLLATGHISAAEIFAVTAEARKKGIKVLITHPLCEVAGSRLELKEQQALVDMGAYIEHCFNACMPALERLAPATLVEYVRKVGAEHCILSTDFGQDYNPAPADGFRMMLANMLRAGLSEAELRVLVQDNPAKLLGLD